MRRIEASFAILVLLAAFSLTNCGTEPTEPDPDSANLSVTKVGEPDPVTVGDEIEYTITVFNGGPDAAVGTRLTDAVPSGTSFVGASTSQGTCSQASGTVTCDLGTLANGTSVTVTLTVRADQPGQVSNTASAASDAVDPNSSNNSDTAETVVELVAADVSLTKLSESTSVLLGADIVYTITVRNDGPGDATEVEVTDVVPAGTSFLSANPSQGSCSESAGTVTCDLGGVPAGAGVGATVTLTVRAEEEGIVENTASVSARQPDPDEANNSDSDDTGVATLPADLRISKAAAVDAVAPGQEIEYTITVRNNGPNDVGAVRVTDVVPNGTTFVSALASQGDCTETTGTVTCDLGEIEVFRTATITLTVQTGDEGSVINTAVVESTAQDTIPGNDTATDTTTVTPLADLSVIKDDEADPVQVGEDIVYTILVINGGPSDATAVVVTDSLAIGTEFQDVTTTAGECDERREVVTCDIAQLAAGDTVNISIVAEAQAVGVPVNRAYVASDVVDPNPDNNTDPALTNVLGLQADLSITKTGPAMVSVGDTITYTINVTNNGPDTVDGVTVTDVVPPTTTFVSADVSPGSCGEGGGVVTCNLASLPSGVGQTITLKLEANAAGMVTNTADVNVPSDATDPDPSNNSASEMTMVN